MTQLPNQPSIWIAHFQSIHPHHPPRPIIAPAPHAIAPLTVLNGQSCLAPGVGVVRVGSSSEAGSGEAVQVDRPSRPNLVKFSGPETSSLLRAQKRLTRPNTVTAPTWGPTGLFGAHVMSCGVPSSQSAISFCSRTLRTCRSATTNCASASPVRTRSRPWPRSWG